MYLRLWIIGHTPINSDEAVVGLMARGILHGHFSAFFWGQSYGGAEPYVVAGVFAVFGQSAFTLTLAQPSFPSPLPSRYGGSADGSSVG